jgi:cellulose synthase/poly-beta-1,6-N-acetylglucosamine synthase-like glycosyltransferase
MYICELLRQQSFFIAIQSDFTTQTFFYSKHIMLFLNEFQDYFIHALNVDMDWKPGPIARFFAWTVFSLYIISLIFTTVYCLMQFQLYRYYRRYRKLYPQDPPPPKAIADADLPMVTIQLPMFNEKYVVEKLVDIMMKMDYPKDKFEVHVIDDSNDETVEIAQKKVNEWKAKGYQIEYIRRPHRQGYKAGALKDAMPLAKGEFLAIFDADFEPYPSFLRKTIPYFQDPKIGVVQTRWEHINEEYSLITKLQVLPLNVHFTVEQLGRMAGGLLLQFNGTAGVWRKKTIEDAGGWESDTLTEDLDLSIRAQLEGYRIMFLEKLGSPAELPAEMNSFKAQQHRWMKGGAETARKMLPTIWKSDRLGLWQKIQATFHLMGSTLFLMVFMMGIMSVPVMHTMSYIGIPKGVFTWFMVGFLSMVVIYYTGNVTADISNRTKKSIFWGFLWRFPMCLSLSLGLALHNARAVIEGWRGQRSEFVRTPKFNIANKGDAMKKGNYIAAKLKWETIFEGILMLYFIFGVLDGLLFANTEFLTFHLMLAVGYGSIFFYTLNHLYSKK